MLGNATAVLDQLHQLISLVHKILKRGGVHRDPVKRGKGRSVVFDLSGKLSTRLLLPSLLLFIIPSIVLTLVLFDPLCEIADAHSSYFGGKYKGGNFNYFPEEIVRLEADQQNLLNFFNQTQCSKLKTLSHQLDQNIGQVNFARPPLIRTYNP